MIDIELDGIGRWRSNIIKVHLVQASSRTSEVVPLKNRVLVGIHEARAGLTSIAGTPSFDRLKFASSIESRCPRNRALTDLLMLILESIDTQGHRHIKIGTLLEDPRHVRKDSLLDLSVGLM